MKDNRRINKTEKFFAISLIFIIISTFFISCRKKTEEVSHFEPRFSADTKAKIHIAGHYSNFEALEAEFDRFNEFYPEAELVYSYLDNYNETIKSAIAGSSAPDIYMTFQWMLDKPDYDALFENAQNMADEKKLGFNLSTIRAPLIYRESNGKIPMIPVLCGSYGMLINDDLFKKEGVKIPETYSELIESCEKLKSAGYKSPIMSYVDSSTGLPIIYAYFCKSIQKIPGSVAQLNNLEQEAGEYLRPTLEFIDNFMKYGFIDIEECRTIKNNYTDVILRFFEGNIPIMLCEANTVSGTEKRETQSDAFMKNPFKYSFHIFPTSDEGSDFLNSVAVEFSVNKNSENLAMADEFIRFLIRTEELNNLAKIKRLITTSTDYSFDEIYAPLAKSNPMYLHEVGLMDNAATQMRTAVLQVMTKSMTVDEAVANYGKF